MSATTETLTEEIQLLREKILHERKAGRDVSALEQELEAKSAFLSEAVTALQNRRVIKG